MKRKRNAYIFIQERAFENVICTMAAILSRPQCVKTLKREKGGWHFANDIQCIFVNDFDSNFTEIHS